MIQAPSAPRTQRPILSGILRSDLSMPAPPANSIRPLAVSGREWYTKAIGRPHKGLPFLLCGAKMVPGFTKPAVAGKAGVRGFFAARGVRKILMCRPAAAQAEQAAPYF